MHYCANVGDAFSNYATYEYILNAIVKYSEKMGVSVDKMRQKLNCSANQSHLPYFGQQLTTTTDCKIDFCL